MEERILEATEYLLMALDKIKNYQDFINYKEELIKAIIDIKRIIQNKTNVNDSDENDKKSKISSILGLQFDYDSLDEKETKFFPEYDNKNNKIKSIVNSCFSSSYNTPNNNQSIYNKDYKNNNILQNPDRILNCTESLRNKNKLLNKKEKEDNNINNNKIKYRNKLFNIKNISTKKNNLKKMEKFFEEKKQKEKIDIIAEIIMKMNNKDYIYDILVNIFGNDITDKLLSKEVSNELVEEVQKVVNEIEKNVENKKYNTINDNISKKYKDKIEIPRLKNEKINKKFHINYHALNDNKNLFRQKRNRSINKFKYSEPYQEFSFKDSLRFQTPKTIYKFKSNSTRNEPEIKSYSKNKKYKRLNSSVGMAYHQKPFISATCGYGKYFDEPLQNGGISKLDGYET